MTGVIHIKASDGRITPAVLMHATGGLNVDAPVAIFHHGGPGGHPIRSISAARWGARAFARRGYTTISLLSRISRDLIDQPFGAGQADIAGVVDWAAQLSSGPIVLVGHSSGSVSIAHYQAQTQDSRIRALIHFAPTGGAAGWMERCLGAERYAAMVDRCQALVAEGQGDEPVYEHHPLPPPAPPGASYGYLMSAASWLSWWSPQSQNRNLGLFPLLRTPMLLVTGDADSFVTEAYQDELKRAAVDCPVDTVMMRGGVLHEFTGAEEEAADLALDWLEGLGIGGGREVETELVDITLMDGQVRSGLVYSPAGDSPPAGAVMLMCDYADDVLVNPIEWIAPRLARAGYLVLVPQDRGSGWHQYSSVLEEVAIDHAAWLDHLAARAHGPVALVGHGWGGAAAAALAAAARAGLVAGVALVSPNPSGADFARTIMGDAQYDLAVAEAMALTEAGQGRKAMVFGSGALRGGEPHRFHHIAEGFLSYWGPRSTSCEDHLVEIDALVLMIDGGDGRLLGREAQDRLAARLGPRAKMEWFESQDFLETSRDALTNALVSWLADTGKRNA